VAVVAFGAVYLVWREGWWTGVRFGLIPAAAILPWMLRNYGFTGSPFGTRLPAKYTLLENTNELIGTMGLWLLLIFVLWGIGWALSSLRVRWSHS
jgi:hypothetical protein